LVNLDEDILMTQQLGAATQDFLRVSACHCSSPQHSPNLGLSLVTLMGVDFNRENIIMSLKYIIDLLKLSQRVER
jgi:hypothetical protein